MKSPSVSEDALFTGTRAVPLQWDSPGKQCIVYQRRERAPNGNKRAGQKEISRHQYTLSTVENLFVAIALHMLEIETGLAKLSC